MSLNFSRSQRPLSAILLPVARRPVKMWPKGKHWDQQCVSLVWGNVLQISIICHLTTFHRPCIQKVVYIGHDRVQEPQWRIYNQFDELIRHLAP
ncbi:hypothetical protein ACN47E_009479 [Coniothyrium glycines]